MTDNGDAAQTDFDRWLKAEYAAGGPRGFTAFAILVKIGKKDVTPLCSTYMHVIGVDIDWGEVTTLFAGSGMRWDAAVFFPKRDARTGGPLDNPSARIFLLQHEAKIADDRLAINEGHFFDAWGRRMRVEEVPS
ncbi:hypothetical protein NK718_03475 [Alsobacter sp. SYSU M60028]|uniref:Uncharacterized protein n=1 Tax=Alsobacter ponti TaxID=2962936 RepID=A0ABT1LBD5_9HYPH|nr:hypothetical protein [Alsobacter ponti]MCP8937563.1 hypothetical protein [Alsobacter ponti]